MEATPGTHRTGKTLWWPGEVQSPLPWQPRYQKNCTVWSSPEFKASAWGLADLCFWTRDSSQTKDIHACWMHMLPELILRRKTSPLTEFMWTNFSRDTKGWCGFRMGIWLKSMAIKGTSGGSPNGRGQPHSLSHKSCVGWERFLTSIHTSGIYVHLCVRTKHLRA